MNTLRNLSHRPHLAVTILLAVIVFLLLTFAAAKRTFLDKPLEVQDPPLAEPSRQSPQTTINTPEQ